MPRLGVGVGVATRAKAKRYSPPAGNVITNWRGTGTGGSSGLPDGWSINAMPSGLTLSVLSRTSYKGGQIIEFQVTGTAGATGDIRILPGGTNANQAPYTAAPGQVWRSSVFAERVSGNLMDLRMIVRTAANGFVSWAGITSLGGTIATGPTVTPDTTAPATTGLVGLVLFLGVTSGQVVSTRYKVFAPTLTSV